MTFIMGSLKGFTQDHICQFSRMEGFIWFYPGFPSYVVAYHDIDDFYFSGHMAGTMMIFLEFGTMVYYKPNSKYCVFIRNLAMIMFFYNSLMMTLFKTHYWIDLMGGLAMGYISVRLGERASYLLDVKIIGLR